MKTITATIKGTTALLQHRFTEQSETGPGTGPGTRGMLAIRGTPREEADKVCYRDTAGRFYFPGAAIGRMLREAGGNHKMKGSRKSAKYVVPSAILVMDDVIFLTNGDGKTPVKDFEVDSRPVVIPATKGRIMRHRPRFDCWSASFTIRINETILPVEFIQTLLNEGGQQDFQRRLMERELKFLQPLLGMAWKGTPLRGNAGRSEAWNGAPRQGAAGNFLARPAFPMLCLAGLGGPLQGRASFSVARSCNARPVYARRGESRQGPSRRSCARRGMAGRCTARRGLAWLGPARLGAAWPVAAGDGSAWQCVACPGRASRGCAERGRAEPGGARSWQGTHRK